MKRTPLKRRTPLKPGKPLARKTPLRSGGELRAVSPTNKRWNAPGRARPGEPMAEVCEAAIPGVCSGRPPTDRHHVVPRGPGSSDEAWNTLDLDADCHQFVHAHPEWSYEHGYLRHRPPPSVAEARAMGLYAVASVALTAAVCVFLLALGGCAEGDAGQVCRQPNAADCPSTAGGESTPSGQEQP